MDLLLTSLGILLCCNLSAQNLDPSGKNVCQDLRDPSTLVCCNGWRQEGEECTIPVCEGEQTCEKDEICVYPGVCRCPAGFYGANCKTRCPPEFWAPDCRKVCQCYPHGHCDPVTGECTCLPNRWGPLCQYACKCARHGQCNPVYGNCTCDEGWWTPTCAKTCQCSQNALGGTCDQLTGGCQCAPRYWGQKCALRCHCYLSPCQQRMGTCECESGWWGPACDRHCNCDMEHSNCDPNSGDCVCLPGYKGEYCNMPCDAGEYGSRCKLSCGHCKGGQPCSVVDGTCVACESGWNGTRCNIKCPYGHYGDQCQEKCPHCRNSEPCDPTTGKCWRCDPGWTGPNCDQPCTDRTFGDACRFLCSPCFHGHCDHVTGRCVCKPGFQGESCNSTCPDHRYGLNCSSECNCGEDVTCHPTTGACPHSGRGALIAGLLVPLLLLILALVFCCCCCGGGPADGKDRVNVADGVTSSSRMKHHVYNVLANVSSAVPCISVWSSGLPRVTVSHHDPELNFNHSFIEPPSSGWVTEGSSFDSDEEEGEALYCVPPREDIPSMVGGEFQEMSSKCNMFLDPSGFSSEDMSLPFAIPRTSSIAKSKRPSVSFAEGTRFSPKERRGSTQDLACPGAPRTKPKTAWGALVLSALQAQGGGGKPGEDSLADGGLMGEDKSGMLDNQGSNSDGGEDSDTERYSSTPSCSTLQVPGAVGRRRTMSNAAAIKAQTPTPATDAHEVDPGTDKITTVYVTVGKTGRPTSKVEPTSEGPVQAMLRRLGSLQRQKDQEIGRPKTKGVEVITKPPRRKLGTRASVWEQGTPVVAEVTMRKPSRRKLTQPSSSGTIGSTDNPPPDGATPKRPLSSILKRVPEVVSVAGPDVRGEEVKLEGADAGLEQSESGYLTVGPVTDAVSLSEVIANQGLVVNVENEPSYENVLINNS
ncbi:scavenger receptor class F member 1 [Osmerus eperlanus]|uniref:scavenger receptor class F member 1 n=1 Tax=Osmerus eperlanus TaxID=29151 RepID=UPI002E0F7543